MIPLPGSPSSSWPMFRAKLTSTLASAEARVVVAFWLFGLINNVLYVIILSSALDLVGPTVPKASVLLFDVIPSFLTKLLAPYILQSTPYAPRVLAFSALSAAGMLLIALTPAYSPNTDPGAMASAVSTKMAGVVLASLASGGGELSFLGLTHFYGRGSLAAWGSGTGAAGLVGAGAYAVATTVVGLEVRTALLASAFLPVGMVGAFFGVLPRGRIGKVKREGGRDGDGEVNGEVNGEGEGEERERGQREEREEDEEDEEEGLLGTGHKRAVDKKGMPWDVTFKANLRRASKLFFPYMLPLLLVYIAEYTINQGVAPTLLFPLAGTPFRHFRAFYPTYNAIYQAGVFISRSSTPFFRVHNLYLPSLLQVANLLLLTMQAVFNFIPSVYIIFAIVFWEGLLGGLVYVNTFAEILDKVPDEDREFSLGATSVSDSGGICIAGFLGMALEVALCTYQVDHGRPYCKKL